MHETIAVAVSGGIDSLTAAYVLKQAGHSVIGIHFRSGYGPGDDAAPAKAEETHHDRMAVIAEQLDIPVHVLDSRQIFKERVVDYFIRTYRKGKTPNPCMVCNPEIKFGHLLQEAKKLGAATLATGHYARICMDEKNRLHLLKGKDEKKDQSYFLAFLTGEQLAAARFPLGGYRKSEIVEMAATLGLRPPVSEESQDVCFIRNRTYGEFLAAQPDFSPIPGPIEDTDGRIIGRHEGLHLFTVGQRRGINCPASEPYYVLRLDPENNRLIVGFKNELETAECRVSGINWIQQRPDASFRANVRVRYRSREVPATVHPEEIHTARIRFDSPEKAVTPGQAAVFYREEEVLGGGWIEAGVSS